jgi:hypothetical protein
VDVGGSVVKNIQVIDGAINAAYNIYAATDEQFALIFPDGADIEFIEDFIERVGEDAAGKILAPLWGRRINKADVVGIHGTLFYELRDIKKHYYPNKRFSDDGSSEY